MSQTSLAELSLDSVDVMYQSENFKIIVEQNLDYIKTNSTNQNGFLQTVEVSDAEAAACEGDLRRVCVYLKIPQHMVWIVMRVNDMQHHAEYKRSLTHILIPDYDLIYSLGLNTAVTQTNI